MSPIAVNCQEFMIENAKNDQTRPIFAPMQTLLLGTEIVSFHASPPDVISSCGSKKLRVLIHEGS